jgi:hypothetical protein
MRDNLINEFEAVFFRFANAISGKALEEVQCARQLLWK